MFVFEPSLLMIGAWHEILQSFVTASIGTICLASGLFGYLLCAARVWERACLVSCALLLMKPGITTDLLGAGLIVLVLVAQLASRRAATAAVPAHPPAKLPG